MLTNLYTSLELKAGTITGLIWGAIEIAIGGIDAPIRALSILICLDFITGISAGYKHNCLSSKYGAKGIYKKMGIFIAIMFAFLLDTAMNLNLFRGMVISGFAIIEGISVAENVDRMGYGWLIPAFIKNKLIQLREEKKVEL